MSMLRISAGESSDPFQDPYGFSSMHLLQAADKDEFLQAKREPVTGLPKADVRLICW